MTEQTIPRERDEDVDVSALLNGLALELLGPEQTARIAALVDGDAVDWPAFVTLDEELGGPSVERVNTGQTGAYEIADRDVFRPFQYCKAYLGPGPSGDWRAQMARWTVHSAGLHIESLVKRIAVVTRKPLGACMKLLQVKLLVDAPLRRQIERFAEIYNIAKHDVSQDKDTHRFSVANAVMAYFVARSLAKPLYPKASLASRAMWDDSLGKIEPPVR